MENLVCVSGHLLRGGQRQKRGEGLLRDQSGDRGDLHEGDVRSREARSVRAGSGGQGRCTFRQAQQQRPAEFRYENWYISPHAFDPLLSSIASKILSFGNSNIREIRVATNLEIFCSSGWKNILLRVEIKVEARVFLPRRKGWGFRWCRCWESIALLMLSGGKVNRDFLSRSCKI